MVHLGKTLLAEALWRSGLLRLWLRTRKPHVLVLAYHRVTPDAEMRDVAYPAMHVSARSFEAQLAALACLYRIVPMSELHALLAGGKPLAERLAVITFDDGYRDNYQQALPVLVRQGVPATFFLSLGFVEAHQTFWFDRLAQAARAWDPGKPDTAALRRRLPVPLVAALDAPRPLSERLRRAAAHLKELPDPERQAVVSLLAPPGPAPDGGSALRWREVAAMQGAGMRIGAHGVNHAILTRMAPEEVRLEMRRSLDGLSQRLGTAVREFAYPNGDADARVAELASQCGVQLAFTMQGRALYPGEDLLRLGRRNACEDTSRDAFGRFSRAYFYCEITGTFDLLLRRAARTR